VTYNLVGTFYICPTPIGNLDDVSTRILDTLKNVDLIYCEDTRRAKKLLGHFQITTPVNSYFLGNEHKKIKEVSSYLLEGKNVALISDAGTPLISDPGSELISYLVANKHDIISIPGPSSVLVALTISGFDLSEFQFLGFIPKSGKEKIDFALKLLNSSMTSVCFTSPKRINKDILFFQEQGLDTEIVVCRELTKKFETIYRGSIDDIGEQISDKQLKGEITLVIAPPEKELNINYDLDSSLKVFIENEVPKREIAKAVSNITEYSANEIYERIKDL
jgi:16S rRNA (cytidine1402-2'-O)-methyltransferase